jgi:hypothetical protein
MCISEETILIFFILPNHVLSVLRYFFHSTAKLSYSKIHPRDNFLNKSVSWVYQSDRHNTSRKVAGKNDTWNREKIKIPKLLSYLTSW